MRLSIGNNRKRDTGCFVIEAGPKDLEILQVVGKKLEGFGAIEVVVEGSDEYGSEISGTWDKDQWTEKKFRKFYKESK